MQLIAASGMTNLLVQICEVIICSKLIEEAYVLLLFWQIPNTYPFVLYDDHQVRF